jgi:hypothetical protein
LMLVGDFLAYIDIFAAVFLLGILSRATTILFIVKQVTARVARLASGLMMAMRGVDFRHRRERGTKSRNRLARRRQNDEDERAIIGGFAWA